MASLTSSWIQTHPSFMEPELVLSYNQKSGAYECLAGADPRVKIGSEDKWVYARTLAVRHQVQSNPAAGNMLPSASLVPQMIRVQTYLNRSRAEYDHHDVAMGGEWGFSTPEAYRLANRQGHNQRLRDMLLYGIIPSNGEGLLNAAGATALTLPADGFGHSTIITYDPGAAAQFILSTLLGLKTRTNQLGAPSRFVVLGPQRVIGQWEFPNIVQLVDYQRPGAGSATTVGTVEGIVGMNNDTILFACDDTLIGKGAGGNDAVLFIMPEVKKPEGAGPDTNEFANLQPSMNACTLMYLDMPAPLEIPTPIPGGGIDVLFEQRATPGWGIRPEAITILSAQYQ